MTQLSPSRYKRLGKASSYASSDGVYYDSTNDCIVIVKGGTILQTITSDGTTVDFEFSSEARGDIIRRGASTWGRYAAKTSGQFLMGDGTDVVSQALSGDVASVSAGGSVTLNQRVLKYYDGTSFAKAAIIGTSAGQLGHANGGVVLAAPGTHEAIEFISGIVILNFDTAAYTGGGDVTFNYTGGGAVSAAVSFANSIGGSADKVALVAAAVPTNNQLLEATGISLVVAAAPTDPGTAAGTVTAFITYRIHQTGL